nr:MAG TPA: hypothetical protein [Crassvirales sp.]
MARKTTKKSTRKTSTKAKSTGSSRSSKVLSRTRSSNRKVAQQANPFQQQGAAQMSQGAPQEQEMYARGGKLKKKKCCRK